MTLIFAYIFSFNFSDVQQLSSLSHPNENVTLLDKEGVNKVTYSYKTCSVHAIKHHSSSTRSSNNQPAKMNSFVSHFNFFPSAVTNCFVFFIGNCLLRRHHRRRLCSPRCRSGSRCPRNLHRQSCFPCPFGLRRARCCPSGLRRRARSPPCGT